MTAIDRVMLAKIMGMLGSEHDGEVLAAARQIEKARKIAGMTWYDVLQVTPPVDDELRVFLQQHELVLTPWERQFLVSLYTTYRGRKISDRQREILDQIILKCRAAAGFV